jgi:hypothetical protein
VFCFFTIVGILFSTFTFDKNSSTFFSQTVFFSDSIIAPIFDHPFALNKSIKFLTHSQPFSQVEITFISALHSAFAFSKSTISDRLTSSSFFIYSIEAWVNIFNASAICFLLLA